MCKISGDLNWGSKLQLELQDPQVLHFKIECQRTCTVLLEYTLPQRSGWVAYGL